VENSQRAYSQVEPETARASGTARAGDTEERFEQPLRNGTDRVLRAGYSLLRIHFEIAQHEAARDQQRMLRGMFCLGVAAVFLVLLLFSGQALVVALLRDAGLKLSFALLAVVLVDVIFGLLLFVVGRRALRAPMLPQTRAVLRRTLSALLDP
jgi:hypothetical protein